MDRQAAGEGRPRPHGGLPQMHALEGCGWSCGLEAREEAVMTVPWWWRRAGLGQGTGNGKEEKPGSS